MSCQRIANTVMLALVLVVGQVCVRAQTVTESPGDNPTPPPEAKLSAAEIEQLVAPIALYPDVLIAQILPAATFPTDVVLAARWLRFNPAMAGLDEKPWDESVKVLCHYPNVLFKMDEDLDWTNALGAAFLAQQDDVMNAIQRGREKAQADGLLKTNEQQTVVVEEDAVRIVPTQADVVYVPQYNPEVIYVDSGVSTGAVAAASAISFGTGMALGAWLNMDCNWHGSNVYYCQPGYWGGWAHRGTVAWGEGWAAGVGPRRAFAVGEDRGVVAGPRGGAAWGPNGGAVWHRPAVATPMPAFSGRYAGYGARYGGRYGSNNQVNLNRTINNTSIDRGNRTSISGGDRTSVSRGDRTSITGGDRASAGAGQRADRIGGGSAQQLPAGGSRASGLGSDAGRSAGRSSAFDSRGGGSQLGAYGQRGQQSRSTARSGGGSPRPSSPAPRVQPSRSSSRQPSSYTPRSMSSGSSVSSRSSAFSSGRSGGQTRQYSSRGAASRGFGGGGGRRGGGRR